MSLWSASSASPRITGGTIRPVMHFAIAANTAAPSAAPAPEVPTGQQKVTDDVTVTYEIQ